MKRISTLILVIIISIITNAQSDTVNTMPGYANDVYYSLDNNTVKSSSGSEWSIAFATSPFSVSAYINDGRGVELFQTTADTSTFSSVDTTGMVFTNLFNQYSNWYSSAFEENATGSGNYGWGNYNTTSHIVTGTRIYILKAISGTYYKVWIIKKASGIWHFRYATLDNSIDETIVIPANDYSDRNFVYFDVDNNNLINEREPVNTEWDLLFTKYYDVDIPYAVTGVLTNDNGLKIAQVDGVDPNVSTHIGQTFSEDNKEIGSDYKVFNMSTFSYDIVEDRTYFIKRDVSTADLEIYKYNKIVFTGFDGSSTGEIYFNNEMVLIDTIQTTIDVNEIENMTFVSVYPNPTNNFVNLVIDGKINSSATITIYNTVGQAVYSQIKEIRTGIQNIVIDTQHFEKGMYFIQIDNDGKIKTIKLQVK